VHDRTRPCSTRSRRRGAQRPRQDDARGDRFGPHARRTHVRRRRGVRRGRERGGTHASLGPRLRLPRRHRLSRRGRTSARGRDGVDNVGAGSGRRGHPRSRRGDVRPGDGLRDRRRRGHARANDRSRRLPGNRRRRRGGRRRRQHDVRRDVYRRRRLRARADGIRRGDRRRRRRRRRHRRGRRWGFRRGCRHHGRRRRGSRGVARRRRGVSRRRSRRQEAERIDVALFVRGRTHAELEVRLAHPGIVRRSDRPDAVALGDSRALLDRDRPQMRERHRPTVRGLDRHDPAALRHRAREGGDPGRGRDYRFAERARDVDAPVLPRCVRTLRVERERLQHDAGDRPRPGASSGRAGERKHQDKQGAAHGRPLGCLGGERLCHRREAGLRCQKRLQTCHKEPR
jgi:hypothetical protein